MPAVRRFEDLEVWKAARMLARAVFQLTRRPSFRRDDSLADQLRRACVSAMANIAEEFERARPRELMQFLRYAKGSVAEVRSLLYLASDAGLVSESEIYGLHKVAESAGRLAGGFLRYLSRPPLVRPQHPITPAPQHLERHAPPQS